MTRPLRALAVLLTAALGAALAAPGPARGEEQLVYRPLVTNGTEYRRVSYPNEAGPLLVLADTAAVIEAAYAPVSYWPITREYLADFSRGAQPAKGSIEIVDASGRVTVAEPEPYVLWYPQGVGAGSARLVRGSEAESLYEDYVREARAAAERAKAHQRLVAESRAAVAAWLRMAAEGRDKLPPPPPELTAEAPEPYRAYASEPRTAAVVVLPAGTYTVRLRDGDGRVVPHSERELVSFAALQHGVGYVLRPADRWTQPVLSLGPDAAVYTTGRTDLFFQPVPVLKYEARRFTRLFRPQSIEVADPSLTMWVPRENGEPPADDVSLALWHRDALAGTLPLTPYRVAQLPGVSRGYEINAFEPQQGSSLQPDFHAMRIASGATVSRVSLLDGAGEPVGASERLVRRVSPPAGPWLFLPAFLPLAVGVLLRVGAALRARRRRRAAAVGAGSPAARQ